jgi:hypothetical protein
MRFPSIILVASICASGLFAQQSLIPFQGQVVAYAPNAIDSGLGLGDLAPGCGGDRFSGLGLLNPVIDGSGRILFRGRLVSNTGATLTPTALQFAYFQGDSRGNLIKILRGGDPEPSGTIPNAFIGTNTGGNGLLTDPPRVTENGMMMFTAQLHDNGIAMTSADDTALYFGAPGSFAILAREGSVAPGCGGAIYNNFTALSPQVNCANSAGWAVFQASFPNSLVTVPPVTTSNNGAVFRRDPSGAVSLVLRKGDFTPNGEQLNQFLPVLTQMNSSGAFVCDVTYVAGTGSPAVTAANDRAVWLVDSAGTKTVLVREGDGCPAIPGAIYSNSGGTWSHAVGGSCFNSSGQLLSWSTLTGSVATGIDDAGLFQWSTTGHGLVFRRGDLAPGVQGTHPGAKLDSANISSLVQNDAGQVAFAGTLVGGGVTTANDSGVWTGTAGNLQLVLREGDVVPGTGGQTFGNTTGVNMHMNANGSLFISNTLSGNNPSLWMWDPVLGLQRLILNGDSIEVQPGVFRTASGQTGVSQFTNGDGRPFSIANDGTIGLRLVNTDSVSSGGQTFASSQFMTVRIGSLTGLPGMISEVPGGTHRLYLNAGAAFAGLNYVVAGSASGTIPGTQIGFLNVPLNIDSYTYFTLNNVNVGPYVSTAAPLNADGRAAAQIIIPPGLIGLAGTVVHHAYGVLDQFGYLVFASEAARLEVIP